MSLVKTGTDPFTDFLLEYWLEGDKFIPSWASVRYYHAKRNLARLLAPSSILEIGVRAGYSALAFLYDNPETRFVGIDSADPQYGGPELAEHAERVLGQFPNVKLLAASSRDVELNVESFDLVHIDGDHSHDAKVLDLELVYPVARWIAVDDYTARNLPAVRRATDSFLLGRLGGVQPMVIADELGIGTAVFPGGLGPA